MTNYRPPPEVLASYTDTRQLPDGRWIGIHQLMFHWTLHVDINDFGYEDRWCIDTYDHALEAFLTWDGTGEPVHWHKHPRTHRRRDISSGQIWDEREKRPDVRD